MKKSMKRIASVIHFTENDTETERYLHLWQLRLGFEHEYWIHGREKKYGFEAKPQTPSHKTINEIPLNFAHTHFKVRNILRLEDFEYSPSEKENERNQQQQQKSQNWKGSEFRDRDCSLWLFVMLNSIPAIVSVSIYQLYGVCVS